MSIPYALTEDIAKAQRNVRVGVVEEGEIQEFVDLIERLTQERVAFGACLIAKHQLNQAFTIVRHSSRSQKYEVERFGSRAEYDSHRKNPSVLLKRLMDPFVNDVGRYDDGGIRVSVLSSKIDANLAKKLLSSVLRFPQRELPEILGGRFETVVTVQANKARNIKFRFILDKELWPIGGPLPLSAVPKTRSSGTAVATGSLKSVYPYYLANEAVFANTDLEVTDKYSGEVATRVAMADARAIDAGITAAVNASEAMRNFAPYQRQAVLEHCVQRFRERFDELAMALCIEAGKPIKDARGEVTRLIDTFKVAAEESVRINGETINLEIAARAKGYRGFTKRVPIGPCSFISPFNFPLNLAAHKIAPGVAAGCPFVLKPASRTPIGALIIGEILAETDLPKGAFSILPAHRDGADLFTTDDRLKLLSFTGSPSVGWDLKAKAGKKKVVLELGGNAACIVDADQRDRIDLIIERLIFGAFYQSGQSCIGVQRILVHESLYDDVRDAFVAATKKLVAGDPRDEKTFVGPMIDEKEARRLDEWIQEAAAAGAKILCGGKRTGTMLEATILENVDPQQKLSCMEAFGPVVTMQPYSDFDDALRIVNDSEFGLQAGIFTNDINKAMHAWDELDVGGVLIGDIPSFRVDNMPYGGVKDSGLGREGIRYAIEDMTELRLLVIKDR